MFMVGNKMQKVKLIINLLIIKLLINNDLTYIVQVNIIYA